MEGHTESLSPPINPWRFASKRHDPETGWIHFGRRYFDPEVGRWTTPAPRGFENGPNLYAYVHNSPLTHIDMYGLCSCCARCPHCGRPLERHDSWGDRAYRTFNAGRQYVGDRLAAASPSSNGGHVFAEAHSQGGLIMDLALKRLGIV